MKRWLWPFVIILSALSAGLAAFILPAPGRGIAPTILLSGWFLLICPGMAFVRLLRLPHWLDEWLLAVALSLALNTLVAEFMLYVQFWSPKGILLVIIGLSLVGATWQLLWLGKPSATASIAPVQVEQ